MPSPTRYSVKPFTAALLDFINCSIVCLSSFTNGWLSNDTSLINLAIEPSTIFATISAGLPDSAAFATATARSLATSSAGTPDASSDFGLVAAICIATSFANVTSPPEMSTNTPTFAPPWMYEFNIPVATVRTKRRMATFSPILPTKALRVSSTVEPLWASADNAATSAGFCVAINSATLAESAKKSSFFATKSVSQFTSTIAPNFWSAEM